MIADDAMTLVWGTPIITLDNHVTSFFFSFSVFILAMVVHPRPRLPSEDMSGCKCRSVLVLC